MYLSKEDYQLVARAIKAVLLEALVRADHDPSEEAAAGSYRTVAFIKKRLAEYLPPNPDREVSADSTFDQAAERPQGLLDSGGWTAIVSNGGFLMTNPSYRKGKVVGLLCPEFGSNEIAAAFYNLGAYNEARRQAAIESPKEKT